MKTRTWLIGVASAAILAGIVEQALAEANPNPYQSIIDRNAFALKPPPPPPEAPANTPPPPPPTNVKLTGVTSMFGSKLAFLEILEPGPGKTAKRPMMKEGQREGPVEVVSINVEKALVKLINAGTEITMGLSNDTARAPSIPMTHPTYPTYPNGMVAPPLVPNATTSFSGGGNIAVPVAGSLGSSGRSTVAVSSGGPATTTTPTYGVATSGSTLSANTQPAYTGVAASAYGPGAVGGGTVPGLVNVPTRSLRVPTATDGSAGTHAVPQLDPAVRQRLLEMRANVAPPHPANSGQVGQPGNQTIITP